MEWMLSLAAVPSGWLAHVCLDAIALLLMRPDPQVCLPGYDSKLMVAETLNEGEGEVRFRLPALEASLQTMKVVELFRSSLRTPST
jgi:hypothetical protein